MGFLLQRPVEFPERVIQQARLQLHVFAGRHTELQRTLLVQLFQADPVLLVDLSRPQRGDIGPVHLGKPARLLGNDRLVLLEHVHDKVLQLAQVLLVLRALVLPLIVDISQEIRAVQILLVLQRRTVVLRRHQVALHVTTPHVTSQQRHCPLTEPICRRALAKVDDAVVLRPKGHEGPHGRAVAPLDITAEELTALAEAQRVDGGRGRDDGVRGDVLAELIDLVVHVAPKGGALVGLGVRALGDDVHEDARVDGFGEGSDGLDAIISVGISETCRMRMLDEIAEEAPKWSIEVGVVELTMPDDQGQRSLIVVIL